MIRIRFAVPVLAFASFCALACGSNAVTHRYVDTPVGFTDAYGAPRGKEYAAKAEAERELIRITVFERSQCDKLRVQIFHHVDEAVKGDTVISREPPTTIQKVQGVEGTVPCNERWARNVWVALRVGDQTYRLGQPSPKGEVIANLSGELKQSLYGAKAPAEAVVVVDGADAGTVSLAGYASHESRVEELLANFRDILSKDDAAITKEDIARSYELYEQLGQLDTGADARIKGLRVRFIELVYQRKAREATENLKRNIAALNEAKNLLPAIAAGAVPSYVISSVENGQTSSETLIWARGQVALALRQNPALCDGNFSWGKVGALDPASRLAFSYAHYAYDDPFRNEIQSVCSRLR